MSIPQLSPGANDATLELGPNYAQSVYDNGPAGVQAALDSLIENLRVVEDNYRLLLTRTAAAEEMAELARLWANTAKTPKETTAWLAYKMSVDKWQAAKDAEAGGLR